MTFDELLSDAQHERLTDLRAEHTPHRFEPIEVRPNGDAVIEHDGQGSAGTFLLLANGELGSSFVLRVGPSPYDPTPRR